MWRQITVLQRRKRTEIIVIIIIIIIIVYSFMCHFSKPTKQRTKTVKTNFRAQTERESQPIFSLNRRDFTDDLKDVSVYADLTSQGRLFQTDGAASGRDL